MISTNEQLFETIQRLVGAWCDRRCLRALRHILAGYPVPSPFTDGWGAFVPQPTLQALAVLDLDNESRPDPLRRRVR
jgi:hypothetical protein